MKVRIIKKPTFEIVGIKRSCAKKGDCSKLWKEINSKLKENKIKHGRGYGISYNVKSKKEFSYLAGYKIKDTNIIRDLDLSTIEIMSQEYAIAFLKGRPSNSLIDEAWSYVKESYLGLKGYKIVNSPSLEVFPEGNKSSSDYEMELWIPVEPVDN